MPPYIYLVYDIKLVISVDESLQYNVTRLGVLYIYHHQ